MNLGSRSVEVDVPNGGPLRHHHSGGCHATCHGPFAGLDDPPSRTVCREAAVCVSSLASLAVHQLHPCALVSENDASRAVASIAAILGRPSAASLAFVAPRVAARNMEMRRMATEGGKEHSTGATSPTQRDTKAKEASSFMCTSVPAAVATVIADRRVSHQALKALSSRHGLLVGGSKAALAERLIRRWLQVEQPQQGSSPLGAPSSAPHGAMAAASSSAIIDACAAHEQQQRRHGGGAAPAVSLAAFYESAPAATANAHGNRDVDAQPHRRDDGGHAAAHPAVHTISSDAFLADCSQNRAFGVGCRRPRDTTRERLLPPATAASLREAALDQVTRDVVSLLKVTVFVDIREKGTTRGGGHEEFLRHCRVAGCHVESVALPLGDVAFGIAAVERVDAAGGERTAAANTLLASRVLLLPLLLERKRTEDLASSVIDGRYDAQKALLRVQPYRREWKGARPSLLATLALPESFRVAYLVEGLPDGSSYPPPHRGSRPNEEDAAVRRRCMTAFISTMMDSGGASRTGGTPRAPPAWDSATRAARPLTEDDGDDAVMEELLGLSSFRPTTVASAALEPTTAVVSRQEPTFFVHRSASLHETAKLLKGMSVALLHRYGSEAAATLLTLGDVRVVDGGCHVVTCQEGGAEAELRTQSTTAEAAAGGRPDQRAEMTATFRMPFMDEWREEQRCLRQDLVDAGSFPRMLGVVKGMSAACALATADTFGSPLALFQSLRTARRRSDSTDPKLAAERLVATVVRDHVANQMVAATMTSGSRPPVGPVAVAAAPMMDDAAGGGHVPPDGEDVRAVLQRRSFDEAALILCHLMTDAAY